MPTHKEKVKMENQIIKGMTKEVVKGLYMLILRLDARLKSVERQIGRRSK